MLTKLTSLMAQWASCHISWLGKITDIKMTLLPKILNFFCMLPVNTPLYYMCILQQCFSHFIWGWAHPKLPRPTIFLPKNMWWSGTPPSDTLLPYSSNGPTDQIASNSAVQCIDLLQTSSLYTPSLSGTELNIGEITSHPTFLFYLSCRIPHCTHSVPHLQPWIEIFLPIVRSI